MATVTAQINASPDAIFEVLSNGWHYSNWVVGTSHVRAVQAQWPAVGSRIFHASGIWPLVTRDETISEELDAPSRLVLTAKGRPFGQARVTIELHSAGPSTLVTMTEVPCAGPGRWLHNPLTDVGLARRNTEALARLTALVERHAAPR